MAAGLACPRCTVEYENPPLGALAVVCPVCRLPAHALRFEPRPEAAAPAPLPSLGGEAVCFFHPANPAARACGVCGRYVCGLCDVEADGQHSCPACFEQRLRAQADGEAEGFRASDTLYDSMALAAGYAWVILYPFWIFSFLGVAYWTAAKGTAPRHYVVPRRPWRFLAAIFGVIALPVLIVLGVVVVVRLGVHR